MARSETAEEARRWSRQEDQIIEVFRAHLKEAHLNSAIGRLTLELVFHRGGIRQQWIGCQINYRFAEGAVGVDPDGARQ